MGMNLTGTIAFGVVVSSCETEHNKILEKFEYQIDDWWVCHKNKMTYEDYRDMATDDFEDWWELKKKTDPCPFMMDYAGVSDYTTNVLVLPETVLSSYYDPVKFTPEWDLVEPPKHRRKELVEILKLLNVEEEPSWIMFPCWM